jgi:hypothetical protein
MDDWTPFVDSPGCEFSIIDSCEGIVHESLLVITTTHFPFFLYQFYFRPTGAKDSKSPRNLFRFDWDSTHLSPRLGGHFLISTNLENGPKPSAREGGLL